MNYEGKRAQCEAIIDVEKLERITRCMALPEKYKNYIPHVSQYIRSNDPSSTETYTPKFVSIGPYFCKEPALKHSNSLKEKYLVNLFRRGREGCSNRELLRVYDECLKCVKEKEEEARAYYADNIDLTTEEFAAMLVLDGSFILEHLINCNLEIEEKQLWSDKLAPKQLWVDLIMLENQVPFFILEELFKHVKDLLVCSSSETTQTQNLKSMVLWYLAEIDIDPNQQETVYHMLHLVHIYARPQREKELQGCEKIRHVIRSTLRDTVKNNLCRCTEIKESDAGCSMNLRVLLEFVTSPLRLIFFLTFVALEYLFFYVVLYPVAHILWWGELPSRDSIPSAAELKKVMVKVKKEKNVEQNSGMKYNVRLRYTTLFMSEVTIDGYTAPFLKNLVALEETLPSLTPYFSYYAHFMQNFIRTKEDVALLQAEGILDSNLGTDDELISYFNNLFKYHFLRKEDASTSSKREEDANPMPFIEQKLMSRYTNPVYLWCSIAVTNYFSNPWTIIALLVAAVQFLQTMLDLRGKAKRKEL